MYRFYLAAVDMLPSAILLIPIYWTLNKVYFHNCKKSTIYCLFSCYLAAIYVLVGMPNVTYVRVELNLNLIPVVGMLDDWKNSILNILLFLLLGIMLPILWNKFRNLKNTLLFGFLMSCAIELLQILTYRTTDVNDLITNTLGAFLGFFCAKFLMKKSTRLKNMAHANKTGELTIILGITLPVMFFVYPFVSSALWDLIL